MPSRDSNVAQALLPPLPPLTARATPESPSFSLTPSPRLPPRLRVSASNRTPRPLHRPPFSKVFSPETHPHSVSERCRIGLLARPSERGPDVLPPLSPLTARGTPESRAFSPPSSPRLPPRLRVSASNRTPRLLHRPPFPKVFSALPLRSLRLCVESTFPSGKVLSALSVLLLACFPISLAAASLPYFSVLSEDAGAWPDILSSIGLERQPAGLSRIFVDRKSTRLNS